MRTFVRFAAGTVIVVSSVAILVGLVGVFTQTGTEQTQAVTLLGSGFAGILFSGMAWILVDIANVVAPERISPQDVNAVTPAGLDAFRQKLSELPDKELTRLSHNTSRGLPAYKAIMDEMDRRAKAEHVRMLDQ
jgi:hypothetical protein